MKNLGAEVQIHGAVWDESHSYALSLLEKSDDLTYMSPFDDPLLWKGHSTMIDECADQMEEPDFVVVAVGGGGLLCGVAQGMERNGWHDAIIVAAETTGAASYKASLEAGELTRIASINTIATTLGARQVASEAFEWSKKRNVLSHVVSDTEAVKAAAEFAISHNAITEPSCGAALSFAEKEREKRILIIVCGGVAYNFWSFARLCKQFEIAEPL
jgi:L-serine/L-threonine ammonia-lyase